MVKIDILEKKRQFCELVTEKGSSKFFSWKINIFCESEIFSDEMENFCDRNPRPPDFEPDGLR